MKLKIEGQTIAVTQRDELVSGTVMVYTAEFAFDPSWDGYTPAAVFEGRGVSGEAVSREQIIDGGVAVVPWETLLPNGYLRVGVYGVKGDQRLPTIYTDRQFVARGAEQSEPAAEPTPGVVDQVLAKTAEDRAAAESAAKRAEDAVAHNPYPNAETGTWWVWDAEAGAYKDSGVSVNPGYQIGNGLKLDTATNTLSVDTADAVEQDNTKPITSAAVFVEVGNIEALLAAL